MANNLLLLDVAPDPVSSAVGISGLILIAVIVLMLAAAGIVGFVFLLKRLNQRHTRGTSPAVGESSVQPAPRLQPNSPNQP